MGNSEVNTVCKYEYLYLGLPGFASVYATSSAVLQELPRHLLLEPSPYGITLGQSVIRRHLAGTLVTSHSYSPCHSSNLVYPVKMNYDIVT